MASTETGLASGEKAIGGKYEIIRKLPGSGMAEAYYARGTSGSGTDKIVVLKRVVPELAAQPDFVRAFLEEARLAATLSHANVAPVRDFGADEHECYLAAEYVHGQDLRSLLRAVRAEGEPLSGANALRILIDVLTALHHAHTRTGEGGKPQPILHRDVAPQNVIVTYEGGVKVTDFGVARALGHPGDPRFAIARGPGTNSSHAGYLSPEQCRGEAVDARSDVFSASILLWELTAGRRLFRGAVEADVMRQIVEMDAPPPSRGIGGYPAALEAIVMRGLARDPARRFPTALAMAQALEAFAGDARVQLSQMGLAACMNDVFGAKVDAWREAQREGKDLGQHLAEAEPEPIALEDAEIEEVDPEAFQAAPPAAARPGPAAEPPAAARPPIAPGTAPAPPRSPVPQESPEELEPMASDEIDAAAIEAELAAPETGKAASAPALTPRPAEKPASGSPKPASSSTRTGERASANRGAGGRSGAAQSKTRMAATVAVIAVVGGVAAAALIRSRGASDSDNPTPPPAVATTERTPAPAATPPAAAPAEAPRPPAAAAPNPTPGAPGAPAVKPIAGTPAPAAVPAAARPAPAAPAAAPAAAAAAKKPPEAPPMTKRQRRAAARAAAAAAAAAAPGAKPAAKAAAPAPAAAAGGAPGRLLINATPWAEVIVDGKPRGATPLSIELPAGAHHVVCVSQELHKSETLDINVGSGETVRRKVVFKP